MDEAESVEKLDSMIYDWQLLRYRRNCNSDLQKVNEFIFKDQLEDLFDIAHPKIKQKLGNRKDLKKFFLSQREKGRPGFLQCLNTVCTDLNVPDETDEDKQKKVAIGKFFYQSLIK